MKKQNIFLILILFALFLSGCKYDFILPEVVPPIDTTTPTSFATKIIPIFTEKCNTCHNTQTPKLTADVAYAQVVPTYVNIATPASSKIYINAKSGHYATVSGVQAALILQWVKEGALNN